jgi:hypothetical protein
VDVHLLFSSTSLLGEDGWSTLRPGRFTPRKEHGISLYKRIGGPQGRSGRVQKSYPPPGFDAETVQPVASSYTAYPSSHLHLMSHAIE